DFEIVGESEREPDMLDVLLVATRTENVEQRQAAVESAGLVARVVDVEDFAVESACQLLIHQMLGGGADKFNPIVDFDASPATLSEITDGKFRYTRDFSCGGLRMGEERVWTIGLSMLQACNAKE